MCHPVWACLLWGSYLYRLLTTSFGVLVVLYYQDRNSCFFFNDTIPLPCRLSNADPFVLAPVYGFNASDNGLGMHHAPCTMHHAPSTKRRTCTLYHAVSKLYVIRSLQCIYEYIQHVYIIDTVQVAKVPHGVDSTP